MDTPQTSKPQASALDRFLEKTRRARRPSAATSAGLQNTSRMDGSPGAARPLRIGYIQAANDTDLQLYRPLAYGYLKAYTQKYLQHPIEMRFLESLDGFAGLDIVGISATSQGFARAKEISAQIKDKNRDIVTILGGHHITHLPETLPEHCDVGVRGEGEQSFLELVDCFSRNGLSPRPDNLRSIKGIVFHENGSIVTTGRRELIAPLDTLPFPAREPGHMPYMFSSCGCPYTCAYCAGSAMWDKTRFFTVEYVVSEIEWILEQFPGTDYIPIWDDLFVANRPRLRKIVELVRAAEAAREGKVQFLGAGKSCQ